MKENECKEKKIYNWCASKENKTNVAWGVVLRHVNSYHHHIRPQSTMQGMA